MKLSRKNRGPEQRAVDESNASGINLEELLQILQAKGLYAFKGMSDIEQRRVWFWSKNVIRHYRVVLERNPANIRAAEDLPFSKEEVKLAIKLALPFYAQKNIHSMVRNLRTIYKELGCFQSIETGDKAKLRKPYNRGDKSTSVPYGELLKIHEKYMETVISEKKSLLEEITAYANKLKISN